jgi:glycosyltransferase involved in cell wall biosynthesis
MVSHFKGRILVRVFGREAPHNYTEYLGQLGQGGFWKRVWQIQNRFWFTPSYDSITDIEGKLLRDRAVSLPLALPDRILRSPHRWQGTDRRILFICPRIGSAPEYYGRIYQDFKEHLGHLPHIVGGHQPVPVDDPAVMGFVSDEEMQRWFRDLRVMFYHSREPRHLHYHPLEAVAYGMPLIYMKGGLVEAYMGKDKPGACDTYAEAEEKLRRILDGDEDFVRSVIESQSPLLDTFRPDYVRRMWEERFLGNIMSAAPVPGVLPFHLWRPVPDNTAPETTAETAFQPRRKIGVYLLTANGTGIYKYVTAMLQAAIKLVQGQEWTFDLIWGTHFTFDTSILKLPYPQPEGLTLVPLKARNPIRPFKGWLDVSWWRRSPAYLRLRPLRILVEGILLPVEYVTEVIKGRTLRPRNSRIRSVLSDSRIGRRLLNNRLVQWLLPVSTAADDIYLVNPPPFVKPASFPEIASPPARPYLTLNDVRDMAKQHDVVLFANPFQAISPNVDLDQIQQQPVVITMYDLAHEYTEAWGERSVSISREMAIWGRLAKRVVFGSEYIRNESVKRYNIPYENTRIVRPPPLVIRYTRPDRTEIEVVRTRLNLPERYLLNTGVQGTHKNNLAIFQAMRILRWRGFDVPPLVIGGNESRKMLTGDPTTVYLAVLQQFIRDSGLIIGQDVIIQDFIAEDDLPAVYAGASMGISMSRSESTVHGMILECMLYGTPIIASTIPQNVEQLGTNDEYALLVPPDDAVALADAIQYTLDNPETTQQRVLRATTFIRAKTQEEMAKQFLVIFEEIAASRAANFTR